MRSVTLLAGLVVVGSAAAIGSIAGCIVNFAGDCKAYENCPIEEATSGAGDAGAGGEGGEGGATMPTSCVPSVNMGPVANECGIFVSSSKGNDDDNAGTKESPLKTLEAAIQKVNDEKKRVYACAEEFKGPVLIETGVELYGGLDCAGQEWAFVGREKKTILEGDKEFPALQLNGPVSGVRVEDFQIEGAKASAPGSSSIAVFVNDADVDFVHCEFIAEDGAEGEDGSDGGDSPVTSGGSGGSGKDACPMVNKKQATPGGKGGMNNCGVLGVSIGGNGGDGGAIDDNDTKIDAGSGTSGSLSTDNGIDDAAGGMGEGELPYHNCDKGEDGTSGNLGDTGDGAKGLGMLTADGYVGMFGYAGTVGTPGQGGGGGGGRRGTSTWCPGAGAGASGGGGGAGGCGGQPGKGGGPGGSSIALVSYQADVTLTDCKLTSGLGGDGGAGGKGQQGGTGGNGGHGGGYWFLTDKDDACTGGKGGKGGDGGPGGGGLGGHSLGIAYVGNPPMRVNTKVIPGTSGTGGPDGNGMNQGMGKGQTGISAAEKDFQVP